MGVQKDTYVVAQDRLALWRAPNATAPTGDVHLHFFVRGNDPRGDHWKVRTRRSPLCGTPRCRLVNIAPPEDYQTAMGLLEEHRRRGGGGLIPGCKDYCGMGGTMPMEERCLECRTADFMERTR